MASVIKHARVADNLYVGNVGAAKELSFLGNADIRTVINLGEKELKELVDGVKYYDFVLSSNEMIDAEIPLMTEKLTRIADCIGAGTTLVVCDSGVNLCMLVAGFYLVRAGTPYASLIERLEMTYFTESQREVETIERRAVEVDGAAVGKIAAALSPDDARTYWAEREKRRALACLTNASFRKLLRIAGGEPQRRPRFTGARRTDF